MNTKSLIERDRQVVWHPFTQSGMGKDPLVVVGAEGARIKIDTGEELIDGISSWWCNIHGHGHPALVHAAHEQFARLDHVLFAGCTHEPAIVLAERLLKVLPGNFSKAFFSDNGSTAVEVAIKLAVQYWRNHGQKRTTIIALDDSYHGDTFGALAAGARSIFSEPFEPLLFHVERLSTNASEADIDKLQRLCETKTVAGFIFEPKVLGAGGMRVYAPTVLDRYMEICRAHGVLAIADEVMTGFGRTGPLFASSELVRAPDLICLSKGLTGGTLPLSITACREEVFQAFISSDHSRTFFHGHTYTGNPIACAVANASLSLSTSAECAADRTRIESAHHACAETLRAIDSIEDVRVAGTILAFNIKVSGESGYTHAIGQRVGPFFRERGVLLRPLGNVVYCMPPYCTTSQELKSIHDSMIEFASSLPRSTQ